MIGNLYIIRNTVNDKVYIGKTYKDIDKRFAQHKNDMNKFASYKFYKAMKKHGVDKFHIELIGKFEEGILEEKEIEYIARYDSFHNGYNSTLGGDGKRLLELDEKEVVNYWKTIESIAKTATFFDVSSDTITKILVSNGVYERVPVSERIPLVMYDKLWNRIKFFTCRREAIKYIKDELHMGIPFSVCQRLDEANIKNNIAFEHHWQKYDELFHDGKEFNTRYDKEQFLNGKEVICINNIWFVKERDGLIFNIKTGIYEKTVKEIINRTIRPEKEVLQDFKPFTVKDIAEYYHVDEQSVRRWFRFYKLDLPNKVNKEKYTNLILKMREEGYTRQQISEELEVSFNYVATVFESNPIPKEKVYIEQYDLEGNLLGTFTSLIEAAKSIGKDHSNKIKLCILGERKTAFGYVWKGQL